jgi:hypothetical protein
MKRLAAVIVSAAIAFLIAWPHEQSRFPKIVGFGPTSAFAQSAQAGISPCGGGTLAVTNSSANIKLSTCGPVVILYNITSTEAFYGFGATSSATATAQSSSSATPVANSYSLPGNTFVVLNLPTASGEAAGYLAAITGSSTTTIRIIQGYANS